MTIDASIYGQIQPPANPLEQYGKALQLKALMGQNRLQELQTGKLESDIGKENAVDQLFANAPAGASLESLLPEVYRVGGAKHGVEYQGKLLTQQKTKADLEHTQAQTGDITAGHIAGAWAALAKGGGNDQSVQAAHDMMAPLVGEAKAQEVTQKLLSMPPETRLAYAVSQAGQHKVGQEALKLFFPQAHMQDTGGQITPVSTSTMPGSPAPGTPIPNAAPVLKTATPGDVLKAKTAREGHAVTERGQDLVDARTRELAGNFGGKSGELLAALTERGVSIPAGFRSRVQMSATLDSLLARNPGKTPDEIAEMIKNGQIGFGAEKKETQVAAGVAGRVGVAGEEISQFAPLVEEASKNVPRSKFVPISRLLQTADTNLSDPNLKQLKVYINSMMNAYDQLASRGGTDKDKRAEAHALLTSAESHEALMAGVEAFKKEVVAAQRAADIASRPRSERDQARRDSAAPAPKPAAAPGALVKPNDIRSQADAIINGNR